VNEWRNAGAAVRALAVVGVAVAVAVGGIPACRPASDPAPAESMAAGEPAAPTNRIDIPDAVRRNLGIGFARVESRRVAETLRIPGHFELLPTARREHRAPLGGTVELLVGELDAVEAGTPLFAVESPAWRALAEEIVATRARLASMAPIREAHRAHERSLADKVALWEDRLAQLDRLRAAGGGSAAQFTEARAMLNGTQAELAEVMEKDAQLGAEEATLAAAVRALESRRAMLVASVGGAAGVGLKGEGMKGEGMGEEDATNERAADGRLVVRAAGAGRVAMLAVAPGARVDEGDLVVAVVDPAAIRFRGHALQADLARFREGAEAAIVAPSADALRERAPMAARLALALEADPDARSIDVLADWARAGVAASLEVVLAGGAGELAVPAAAVVTDGAKRYLFRRDPKDPDRAIRIDADLGATDGRFVEVLSGLREGDEVVVEGARQLLLAMGGGDAKGGHFHSDGTFHAEDH
jgi:hypothetical protein